MENKKRIYTAANSTEAYLIKGLLEQRSIKSILLGEGLSSALGGLPIDVMQVKIFVDEEKYTEALKIVIDYEKASSDPMQSEKNWKCTDCMKLNPQDFEICWNCQVIR